MDQRLQARERFRQLPDQQRADWLDIAEDEFRAFGFKGASLNGILARAALSKGQAYYYFADKGELYRAVIERAITKLADLIDARPVQANSVDHYWQQIAALFGNVTLVFKENDHLAELGRGIYREAAAQEAITDLLEALHIRLQKVIDAGQAIGAIRTDLPLPLLTDMAFASMREADRWFAMNAQELSPHDALKLNHSVFSLFRDMLAPSKHDCVPSQNPTPFKD
ncbi:TetR family transcriptional regulator [Altererythrobacter indicus]|uniref:TetR family transcriptional regulator n=1 Tax=Altericroceibacterium indicum TaxID=374177 RepID=A0A845AAH8_9SPHN|nr:TetR/AcrR family transcriptional regulator [Altericroceibacterium indicum]MXP26694.1 TetR family transcriptional regulator [Altericroceibacterium indicum]